ncbi:MAG: MaoC family dehydratase [Phycisphaerales bacterium]
MAPETTTSSINSARYAPDLVGRFWEDIEVGDHVSDYPDGTVLITDGMISDFARLSGDFNPIHVDAGFARRTVHRKPIAHGILLASIALGRYHNTGYTYGTTIALLHTHIDYVGRAYSGDEVWAEFIVTGKETNPHPKRGVVHFDAWLRKADSDETLVEIRFDSIVCRRSETALRRLGCQK